MGTMIIPKLSDIMMANVGAITDLRTPNEVTSLPANEDASYSGTIFELDTASKTTGEEKIANSYLRDATGADNGLMITWQPCTTIYDLSIEFHGYSKNTLEAYTLEPFQISKFVIDNSYAENIGPDIAVVATFTPEQLLSIIDNYRELRAHVYLRRMIYGTETIDYANPVIDKDYIVLLKDKELRKRISKESVLPDKPEDDNNTHHDQFYTNVEFQLVEDDFVKLHKKRFHFIASKCTVKEAIMFAIQQCGLKNVSFVPPDNETVYENFIVPPQQSFKSFILFVQQYYGIYNDGLNFYLENSILYIYPLYRTNVSSDCPETTHFYCTGDGSFQGLKFYHAKDQNNMYHIVINRTPVIRDMMDEGAANIGTTLITQHTDRLIDLTTDVKDVSSDSSVKAALGLGKLNVKTLNTSVFQWESPADADYGNFKDPFMTRFVCTNNEYKYRSELKSYRNSIVAFEWGTAEPNILRPGYAVQWHIDGEDIRRRQQGETISESSQYQTFHGIVAGSKYTLMPAQNPNPSRYPFSCTAVISLELDYLPATDLIDNATKVKEKPVPPAVEYIKDKEDESKISYDGSISGMKAADSKTENPKVISEKTISDNNLTVTVQEWSNGQFTKTVAGEPVPSSPDVVPTNIFDL